MINSMYVTEYATSYEFWTVLVAFKAPVKKEVISINPSGRTDQGHMK
jgi:hypothetical protein